MAVVVKCPHCSAKMSVGEGRVGDQVRCPGCKQHFTVNGKEGSRERSKKSKPVRRRSGVKPSHKGLAILLSVFIGGTFILFCTFVYLANRKQTPDPPRRDSGPETSRPLPDTKDTPRTPTVGKDGKPEPGGNEPSAFDMTFSEVVQQLRRVEDAEPLKTSAALQALPADDRERAEAMMKECSESPSMGLPEYGPKLQKWGLTDWVTVTSSKYARNDPEFRTVAVAYTAAGVNSTELFAMIGKWCLVSESDRKTIAAAAQEDWAVGRLTAETRNAILMLGGQKWLQR